MQERPSTLSGCSPDEIDPVFEPGTIVFINDTAMGIIKVVPASSFPGQVQDQAEVRRDSRMRKTYEASLLTWESKRRTPGSSGVLDKLNFSSTEQLWHHS